MVERLERECEDVVGFYRGRSNSGSFQVPKRLAALIMVYASVVFIEMRVAVTEQLFEMDRNYIRIQLRDLNTG